MILLNTLYCIPGRLCSIVYISCLSICRPLTVFPFKAISWGLNPRIVQVKFEVVPAGSTTISPCNQQLALINFSAVSVHVFFVVCKLKSCRFSHCEWTYFFRTPLMLSTACGHIDAVLVLLAMGANIHSVDVYHRTALHRGVRLQYNLIFWTCVVQTCFMDSLLFHSY